MRSAMRNRLANMRTVLRTPRKTSDSEVFHIADLLWSQLDTPLSLGLSLLIKNGQIEDALRISFDPSRYLETQRDLAAADSQAVNFLRKYPASLPGIDRESAAWEKFLAAEEDCRQANHRIRNMREGGFVPPAVHAVLHIAQSKISHWLSDLDGMLWASSCRFGPGADNLAKGLRVSSYHKLSKLSSTEDFSEGAVALACCHPSWVRSLLGISPEDHYVLPNIMDLEIVPGNRLMFVPKTALVDRSIAIEPRMNIYAQLGLGSLIRSRLKRVGLDLNTQEPSQLLAHRGSVDGTIATIDLSSASDTLAKELVRELIPEPWFNAMDWCRSKTGTYHRGEEEISLYYEKFSSMGNGFTFELESMIFYALALGCCLVTRQDPKDVRAYGDDLAVPTRSVELLEEVLGFCGFSVNRRKSYSSGGFRESCGVDFFFGLNIRPFQLDEKLVYAEALFRLANGLRRVAFRRCLGFGCDRKYFVPWTYVIKQIPPSLRSLKGPFLPVVTSSPVPWVDIVAEDCFIGSNLDEASSSPFVRRARFGFEGWLLAGAISPGRQETALSWAVLYAHALYSSKDGSSFPSPHRNGSTTISLRGSGPRKVSLGLIRSSFLDLGRWI